MYVFQDGDIKFCNRAFCDFSGYSRQEIQSIHFLDLIHPDDREKLMIQTRVALSGGSQKLPKKPELSVILKDGQVRRVQTRPKVIEYQGLPAILGLVIDLTDLNKSE